MSTQRREWRIIALFSSLLIATISCASLEGAPTTTPQTTTQAATPMSAFAATLLASAGSATPAQTPVANAPPLSAFAATLQASAGNATPTPGLSVGGGNGGTGNGNGGPSVPPANATLNSTPIPTPQPTPEPTPPSGEGPYVVKQVISLGGEAISGNVCSLGLPFRLNSVTPHVSFVFNFLPRSGVNGQVSYIYSIPSAGESHDAAGTYTIGPPNADGVVRLSLVVSDHVVFHGFDGNIPNKYYFDLVPVTTLPGCAAP